MGNSSALARMSLLARLALVLPPAAVGAGLMTAAAPNEAAAACWDGSGVVCGCSSGISQGCGGGYAYSGSSYCGGFSGTCQDVEFGCQYYGGCSTY